MNNYEYIKDIYKRYNNDIVIKVNKGTCGINVNHFTKLIDIRKYYNKLKCIKKYYQ